jgi:hypothetical protein
MKLFFTQTKIINREQRMKKSPNDHLFDANFWVISTPAVNLRQRTTCENHMILLDVILTI